MDDNNDIIELLRTFSHQGDLARLFDAQEALQPFGDEAVPAMVEALKDPDADLRPQDSRRLRGRYGSRFTCHDPGTRR